MADVLSFQVSLPPLPSGHDVEKRELAVQLENPAGTINNFSIDCLPDTATVDDPRLLAAQNTQVTLSLIDIDDSDNRSTASTLVFNATDTVPPAQPGELSVHVTGEQ